MSRSNGTRRVNKVDGTKKIAKKLMTRSRRADSKKLVREVAASDLDLLKGYLESQGMPFEQGKNALVYPYIFVSFDEQGNVIEPD